MIKPMVILLIVVAILMGGIFGWQQFWRKKIIGPMLKSMATAPQTVSTIVAAESSWQTQTGALGSVRAVRGADLSAQASGVIDTIHIDSGSEVKAGTVLLTLKPNDDPAKLAQLEAQAELAAITLKRDQEQLAAQAISQATVDTDART
jgi:membrane fusion protein (multidrug efflux system)